MYPKPAIRCGSELRKSGSNSVYKLALERFRLSSDIDLMWFFRKGLATTRLHVGPPQVHSISGFSGSLLPVQESRGVLGRKIRRGKQPRRRHVITLQRRFRATHTSARFSRMCTPPLWHIAIDRCLKQSQLNNSFFL